MRQGWQHKQRGATFLGMVIIIGILGFALYAGIRLVPVYMDYFSVVKALTQTADKFKGSSPTPGEVSTALNARWQVDYIKDVAANDIEINKVANGLELRANYRAEVPFIANVSLAVDFDKAVIISGGANAP